ncbi:hypothetical protein C8R43DRAFT_941018 [Mycena crocata]|nr:hypothetical protein C8R43DRAFT_941018 [Mycena crocata]
MSGQSKRLRAIRLSSKPTHFFRDRVRHLLYISPPKHEEISYKVKLEDDELCEIISACSGIQSLGIMSPIGPAVRLALEPLRPRRLAVSLKTLDSTLELAHPMFAFNFALVPNLTHLSLFDFNDPLAAVELLKKCKKLEVLIDDEYEGDWLAGARGGLDFRARAAVFAAKRRRREITPVLLPAWGHTGSYLYLATQMLHKDPDLVITIVLHNLFVPQMEAELKTCEYDKTRLRIMGVGESHSSPDDAFNQLLDGWKEIIHQLSEGSEKWPKPGAIHMDFFVGGFVVEETKQIMGSGCKILNWFSMPLTWMPILIEHDFAQIAQEIHSDKEQRRGRSLIEILEHVAWAWNGSDQLNRLPVEAPGVPKMYDHERTLWASKAPVRVPSVGKRLVYAQKQAKIVHELCWTHNACIGPRNSIVNSFLERLLGLYGPKSVLYISFGSLYFPVETPELVKALVDTLLALENCFPFIFVLGSNMASLPEDVIARVNASGKGLVCKFWVEQRAILQHGAIGWFLTHGGYNPIISQSIKPERTRTHPSPRTSSVSEALSQGIALIVWPVAADQPVNAALLSCGPNPVAIELMQVRTGVRRAPSLRAEIAITGTVSDASAEFRAAFDAARGAAGAVLEKNAENMARALREAHAGENGEAVARLARF